MNSNPTKRVKKSKKSKKLKKEYDHIKTDQNDNLIINLKDIPSVGVELLPGYIEEESMAMSSASEVCWNCCHTYGSLSQSIPVRYISSVYYMYGEFCSYECATRYVIDTFEGQSMWEVYSLLNMYYNKIHNSKGKQVEPAPSRFVLKMFGGDLTIDEYRSHFSNNISYDTLLPPIVPICHTNIKITNKIKPSENKNNLKLFRKTPLNKTNNIYSTMNLEVTS